MGYLDKGKMPLDVAPIYCAEQIEVPEDLPDILKEWSKSVLRANIETREQLYAFSAEYFGNLSAASGGDPEFADLEDKVPYIREAFRMMQDAFYSIDTDQGGSIDVAELKGMWHQACPRIPRCIILFCSSLLLQLVWWRWWW